jgi:hypothetical protein
MSPHCVNDQSVLGLIAKALAASGAVKSNAQESSVIHDLHRKLNSVTSPGAADLHVYFDADPLEQRLHSVNRGLTQPARHGLRLMPVALHHEFVRHDQAATGQRVMRSFVQVAPP